MTARSRVSAEINQPTLVSYPYSSFCIDINNNDEEDMNDDDSS